MFVHIAIQWSLWIKLASYTHMSKSDISAIHVMISLRIIMYSLVGLKSNPNNVSDINDWWKSEVHHPNFLVDPWSFAEHNYIWNHQPDSQIGWIMVRQLNGHPNWNPRQLPRQVSLTKKVNFFGWVPAQLWAMEKVAVLEGNLTTKKVKSVVARWGRQKHGEAACQNTASSASS